MPSTAGVELAGSELVPSDLISRNENTYNSGTSLLLALQRTYKDRWAILLDSVFSNETAERIMLLNSFVNAKVIAPEGLFA